MFTSADEIFIAALFTALLMLMLVGIVIFAIVRYQRNYRLHIEELFMLKQEYGEEILRSRLEISEEILRKVSDEIHDNIGQMLALAKINLFTINIDEKQLAIGKIQSAKNTLTQAIQDLRELSHTLSPEYLSNFGLSEWVSAEATLIQKNSRIKVFFKSQGIEPEIEVQRRLVIIRIIQEALSNIIKHSDASNVNIDIDYDLAILLKIEDDGLGFPINANTSGLGLINMKSRSKILGGTFAAESEMGKGTILKFEIPYAQK